MVSSSGDTTTCSCKGCDGSAAEMTTGNECTTNAECQTYMTGKGETATPTFMSMMGRRIESRRWLCGEWNLRDGVVDKFHKFVRKIETPPFLSLFKTFLPSKPLSPQKQVVTCVSAHPTPVSRAAVMLSSPCPRVVRRFLITKSSVVMLVEPLVSSASSSWWGVWSRVVLRLWWRLWCRYYCRYYCKLRVFD